MPHVADWVIHCSDPLGSSRRAPRRRPRPDLAESFVEQAEAHGVLGAFLQNFPTLVDESFAAACEGARRRHRTSAVFSLMLSHEAAAISSELVGVPAAVVKGPIFARALYPRPSLRCFSDIDLLVAPEAFTKVSEVLSDRGFALIESHPASDPREWKWLHRENQTLMVEVQTDLIHAESLRRIFSLPYEVIASAPQSPAALLLVALVHGGGHHYQRLQHLVDICQAARLLQGAEEERRFEALVQAANAQFVSAAGLSLAAKIFREPQCRDIARGVGPVRFRRLSGLLLGRRLVMSTTDVNRGRHSWRRSAFRWLMKKTPARGASRDLIIQKEH